MTTAHLLMIPSKETWNHLQHWILGGMSLSVDCVNSLFVSVSIAEVHGALPTGQFISDHCTVEYWTASGPRIIQTSNHWRDNDQVLVLLARLQPETLYDYTVSASNDTLQLKVKVEGVFLTAEIGNIYFLGP